MYEIVEMAILTGGYDLKAMAKKIDALFAADRLTEDEWQKLRKLCLEHLKPEDTRPELQAQVEYLANRVTTLEAKVAALEAKVEALEAGQSGETGGETDYDEWQQPIAGLTDKYQQGAVVRHNGILWRSEYPGQNVWEPGVIGTEQWWVKHTPDA